MKVKRNKLLTLLICVALTVTDILPVGFNVSASELEQSDLILQKEEESENNSLEKSVSWSKSSTDENDLLEEFVSIEDDEIKIGITAEESEVKKEENDTNSMEIGTKEKSSITEENDNLEGDALEEEKEQELNVAISGDNIASGQFGDITWVIDANGKLTVEGTGNFTASGSRFTAPWYDYRNDIISVQVNVKDMTDASFMFHECKYITTIDLAEFDTSKVTSMRNMFSGCSSLTCLDVSGLNTSNVTSMLNMFSGCSGLTSLDINGLNTSNVTNMGWMFSGCSSLKDLNVSDFDTSKVTDMGFMFKDCSSLKYLDVSGLDTNNVTEIYGMFSGCSGLTSLDVSGFDTSKVTDMEYMFSGCESLVSLDVSGFDTNKVTDMEYMFSGCESLASLDVSGFDTSKVTNMESMFSECRSLISLDVSGFDTSNLLGKDDDSIGMSSMFLGCSSLTSIDVSGFDTSHITNMAYMFGDCSSLTSIDVSGFDTSHITNMAYMFRDCSSLESLDLSSFDTENVSDISGMFEDCNSLTSIDVSNFNTENVTDMGYMFYNCNSLISIDLSSFDLNKNDNMDCMLDGCYQLITIYTPYNLTISVELPINSGDVWYQPDGTQITELPQNLSNSIMITKNKQPIVSDDDIASGKYRGITWVIDAEGKLTVTGTGDFIEYKTGEHPWEDYMNSIISAEINVTGATDARDIFSGLQNLTYVDISNFDTRNITNMDDMFARCSSLTDLDLSKLDTSNVEHMNYMFSGCSSLTNLDISGLDTSNVKGMGDMFSGCSSLTSLDISGFDTSNVESMDDMFSGCSSLTSLDVSGFITNNVEYMRDMFSGCSSLTSLDVSSFDTSKVEYMDGMFSECSGLTNLNLSKFDTSNVTDMSGMFLGCSNLKGLDISGFDTINVTNMREMFSGCSGLSSVDVSSFDTRNVTDMYAMFQDCNNLTSLDVSGFDTGNVTGMSWMFSECSSLLSVDVSKFDTKNATNLGCIFYGCSSLTSIDVSGFNTKNATNLGGMFWGCSSLTNIDVSGFNTRNVADISYMFSDCKNLASVDMSSFDTSSVTNMRGMFWGCSSLTNIDVSGFNTRNVTDISYMFYGCKSLTSVDMSSFDVGNVVECEYLCMGCTSLTTIYTPCNLTISASLPEEKMGDVWYLSNGTELTELPRNLSYSIMITKNSVPVIAASYIMAEKIKTTYKCGDSLTVDDLTVRFFSANGAVKIVTDYSTNISEIDMSTAGTKTLIITYNNLTAEIELTITAAQQDKTYTVTFDLCGHGAELPPLTDIIADSLIAEPQSPIAEGYRFAGWYKDPDYTQEWNFDEDTVQENIILYAYWITEEGNTKIGSLFIQKIPAQTYTGSAIKPTVAVYYQSANGRTLLKSGTDYMVKYYNNIEADTEQEKTLGGTSQTDTGNGFTKELAYIVITCKGNYTGTVYQNFHINPVSITGDGQNCAEGFTLKYTEQFVNSTKPLKPFSSLKYKKSMKVGKDYNIRLTVQKAYDDNGNALAEGSVIDENSAIPVIPAGYQGTFLMTITGINNYQGTSVKTIYVTDKNHLMKNASVSLGKNQKNMKYTGDAVTLTPAWYDASAKKYYVVSEDGGHTEADKNNVFTVKLGTEYLLYGRDFTISYANNQAVGNAVMTVTGIGDYVGTKIVSFRIIGTAFNTKNIRVSNLSAALVYTGEALEQNKVILTDMSGVKPNELVCGTDYTVDYKNNVTKGTATMIFTAKPVSGYSGSFKQTFKITAAGLGEITDVTAVDLYNDAIISEGEIMRFDGKIIYTKEGAKPSDRILLTNRNTNNALKEGTDYTVSYVNNKAVTTGNNLATMTIKGKGNYTGIININFPIVKASLSENENLTAAASSMAYNAKKDDDYQYQPQIKLTDKKAALSASKDFEVAEYKNCSQTAVEVYFEALEKGTVTVDIRPYAIIKAREESGYEGSLEVDLNIYQTKLTAKNLYIVVSSEAVQITYTGKQVKPEVAVYYGEAEAIKQARAEGEIKENILTDKSGDYMLTKLNPKENGIGDYTLVYGTNFTAGKNKGSVTVNGAGLYGGNVTVKFTILGKNVNDTNIINGRAFLH